MAIGSHFSAHPGRLSSHPKNLSMESMSVSSNGVNWKRKDIQSMGKHNNKLKDHPTAIKRF